MPLCFCQRPTLLCGYLRLGCWVTGLSKDYVEQALDEVRHFNHLYAVTEDVSAWQILAGRCICSKDLAGGILYGIPCMIGTASFGLLHLDGQLGRHCPRAPSPLEPT